MKRDDPELLKARAERQRAQIWLDVVRKGIGQAMLDACYIDSSVDFAHITSMVNGELRRAVEAVAKAEEAYAPYRKFRTRRRRVATIPNPEGAIQ